MKDTALIFDLDDTLLDQTWMTTKTIAYAAAPLLIDEVAFAQTVETIAEEDFPRQAFYPYCRHIGISPGEVLWGDFGGPGEGLALLRTQGPAFIQGVWERSLATVGITDPSVARDLGLRFRSLRQNYQFAHPQARQVLEVLKKKYFLGILTNGAPEVQWLKIHASGLEDLFDHIVVSGDHGVGKPNPEIFEIARKPFTQARRFVMVGNSINSDMKGAQAAGNFLKVWVDRDEETVPSDLKIDAIYRRLEELPSTIDKLLG